MSIDKIISLGYIMGYFFVAVISHILGFDNIVYFYRYGLIICAILLLISKKYYFYINVSLFLIVIAYLFRVIYEFYWLNVESNYGNNRYVFDLLLWGLLFAGLIAKTPSIKLSLTGIILTNIGLVYILLIGDTSYGSRLALYNLNPISTAFYSSLLIYFVLFSDLKLPRKLILIIIPAIVVFKAGSRSNIFGLVFVLLLHMYKSNFWRDQSLLKKLIISNLALVICFLFIFNSINLETIGTEGDLSAMSRLNDYKYFFESITWTKPFGNALTTPSGGYLHNIYFEIIMSTGLLGVVFVSIVLNRLRRLYLKDFISCYIYHSLIVGMFSGIFSAVLVPLFLLFYRTRKYA